MMRYVRAPEYHAALERLAKKLEPVEVDCVLGIKRSGLFPAVFLSHRLGLPMFVDAEAGAIPKKHGRVLVVDAVVNSGRTLERLRRRLLRSGKAVVTAVLYKENQTSYPVDHFLETHEDLVHFFYERLRWEPAPEKA
jgi:hypoxanthine phosphoribosyltransferase